MSTTACAADAEKKISVADTKKALLAAAVLWEEDDVYDWEEEKDFKSMLFATMPQYCVECAEFIMDPFQHFSNASHRSNADGYEGLGVLHGEDSGQAPSEADVDQGRCQETCG